MCGRYSLPQLSLLRLAVYHMEAEHVTIHDTTWSRWPSDRDSANAESPAVVEYLDKLDDVCVAKTMMYEDKSQRCAAQIAGLKGDLLPPSEGALMQRRQIQQ